MLLMGEDEPALFWFRKAGILRLGLGGEQSSTSWVVDPGRVDDVRLPRERCLFEGGAGGATVRDDGIMALEDSSGRET